MDVGGYGCVVDIDYFHTFSADDEVIDNLNVKQTVIDKVRVERSRPSQYSFNTSFIHCAFLFQWTWPVVVKPHHFFMLRSMEVHRNLWCTFRFEFQDLYGAGARKLFVLGLPPIGCSPRLISNMPFAKRGQCDEVANRAVENYQTFVLKTLDSIKRTSPGFLFSVHDLYGFTKHVIANTASFGETSWGENGGIIFEVVIVIISLVFLLLFIGVTREPDRHITMSLNILLLSIYILRGLLLKAFFVTPRKL